MQECTPAPAGRGKNLAESMKAEAGAPAAPAAGVGASILDLVKKYRAKFQIIKNEIQRRVVGHEDAVNALLYAIISGEHVVWIGPPGISKTHTILLLSKLINASWYKYQLTKETTISELLGSIDIEELAKGRVVRRWSKIVDAEIVYLDEVYKANSIVLNSLLSLMQERIVYDPQTGMEKKANLITLIGSSNETPADDELQALHDRFVLKVFDEYLQSSEVLSAVVKVWTSNNNNVKPVMKIEEVKKANMLVGILLRTRIKYKDKHKTIAEIYAENFAPLLLQLRSRGVRVSDRTIISKAPKVYAAYLIVNGVTPEAMNMAAIDLLRYFVNYRDELEIVKSIVETKLGELRKLYRMLEDARAAYARGELTAAETKVDEVIEQASTMQVEEWMKAQLAAILKAARKLKKEIMEMKEAIAKRAENISIEF